MKNPLTSVMIIIIIATTVNLNAGGIQTFEGIAERSKAGLVVAGIMITTISEEDLEKFAGKKLRIRGLVQEDHKWRINESDPEKKQGFNMPVMYEVISIEIIGE